MLVFILDEKYFFSESSEKFRGNFGRIFWMKSENLKNKNNKKFS